MGREFAGVLAKCTVMTHLNLGYNAIGDAGTESLAAALGPCAALAHFDLSEIFNRRMLGWTFGHVTLNPILIDSYTHVHIHTGI
jgi:Ran GTPase-activating protein (RanGAP) involved in mRNA processing and transport